MAEHPEHFFTSEGDAEPKRHHYAISDTLGAILASGTVVIASKKHYIGPYIGVSGNGRFSSSEVFIGRIVEVTRDMSAIPENEREFLESSHEGATQVQFAKLRLFNPEPNLQGIRRCATNHPRAKHIPEITATMRFVWVSSTAIKDLAFLFSYEEITSSVLSLQGMARVFLLRYDDLGNNVSSICPFPEDFSNCLGESYANRMWSAIVIVHTELRKAMNTSRLSTGIIGRNKKTINLCKEAWNYLKHCVSSAGIHSTPSTSRKKKFFHCPEAFLKTVKRSMHLQVETLVFPMEVDLVGVNLLLGDVATIGTRSHRPRARNLAGQ